jgi:thiol-disulfide isomerase/thioredoxin
MKRLTIITSLLFLAVAFSTSLKAQYMPDTNLTYTTFLRQCQQFTQEDQEEAWVVNFWASHNTPSLYSLPELKELYKEYKYKPVRFISISVDKNRESWEAALLRVQLPWEQLYLPNEAAYAFLRKAFKHRSFPAIFLVNPDGRIQRVVDVPELRLALERVSRPLPNKPYEPYYPTEGSEDEPQEEPVNPAVVEHVVKSGDTLYSIYKKYGVPVAKIKSYNKLTSDVIKVGMVLKIPQS